MALQNPGILYENFQIKKAEDFAPVAVLYISR
jgi:hypothetical protein